MSNLPLDHENIIPLHDELIRQNAEDIREIKEITFGLPQTIERIEYVVTKLSENFEKFLEVADKKYQTKEMCQVCIERQEKEVEEVNERVAGLEKKFDYFTKGILVVLLTVLGFAGKFGLDILVQVLSK